MPEFLLPCSWTTVDTLVTTVATAILLWSGALVVRHRGFTGLTGTLLLVGTLLLLAIIGRHPTESRTVAAGKVAALAGASWQPVYDVTIVDMFNKH